MRILLRTVDASKKISDEIILLDDDNPINAARSIGNNEKYNLLLNSLEKSKYLMENVIETKPISNTISHMIVFNEEER